MVFHTLGVKEGKADSTMEKAGKQNSQLSIVNQVWKTGFSTFATNTTIHGIRFMCSNIGFTRKCFWFLLVLLCSSYMSVQIIERVLQYYSYPTTVNVKINFNKTLSFPALTVCNQNAFKATAAADSDLYGMIEDLFSHNTSRSQQVDAPGFLDLKELYTMTSHLKEDLIVECKWQDTYCGPENFTEVITDHGLCFTFNHDNQNPLWISSAGSDHGIKLTLNVEQYEYMPGPHDAAGVKVLLHDGKEFPGVANLGLAIPTGAHAYVGMQLVRVENLPEPHGTCSSDSSPYYKSYSPDACQLACFTEFMGTECGCRDMYMPNLGGYPPVCSLDQYINCFKPKAAQVHRRVEEECFCPVPCKFIIYDSTISFSATSAYAHERLLATTTTDSLQQKFLKARETTSRMNPIKFNPLVKLEGETRSTFKELDYAMTSVGYSKFSNQKMELETIHDKMKAATDKKLYLLNWQLYQVSKNFIRARQAMEERTLFSALLGFNELGYQIEIRIHQIFHPPSNLTLSEDVKLNLYLETMNMLNGRIDICEQAIKNYTQLYEAYLNATPIFRYKYHRELRNDNDIITPKQLLRDSLFRTSYTRKWSDRVGTTLHDVQKYLRQYSEILNSTYFNNTLDERKLHLTNVMFFNRARTFYQARSEFYKESVEYPENFLKEKIADFERRWRTFESDYVKMMGSVDTILDSVVHLNNSILLRIKQGMDSTEKYIKYGKIAKQQAAQELTSEDIHVGISDLKIFFHELRARGQDVYEGWSALLRSTTEIWDVIINDEDMQDWYEHEEMTDWLRPFKDISDEVEANFTEIRDLNDPRFIVQNRDTHFLTSIDKLIAHMAQYKEDNKMNSKFIKDNFLQLDVFYREKSYEQITQQPAYDIFALICDIGGSMGLFIGASVLSLYEIMELFLHVFLLPLLHRTVKSSKKIAKSRKNNGQQSTIMDSCNKSWETDNPAPPLHTE